mmetsp:Transcript_22979/g.54426  ORF Transcript_22979/g.54426 Transcript_22979/m.54426 type:complete len:334 (+) Transcript_22979:1069-2070(+)
MVRKTSQARRRGDRRRFLVLGRSGPVREPGGADGVVLPALVHLHPRLALREHQPRLHRHRLLHGAGPRDVRSYVGPAGRGAHHESVRRAGSHLARTLRQDGNAHFQPHAPAPADGGRGSLRRACGAAGPPRSKWRQLSPLAALRRRWGGGVRLRVGRGAAARLAHGLGLARCALLPSRRGGGRGACRPTRRSAREATAPEEEREDEREIAAGHATAAAAGHVALALGRRGRALPAAARTFWLQAADCRARVLRGGRGRAGRLLPLRLTRRPARGERGVAQRAGAVAAAPGRQSLRALRGAWRRGGALCLISRRAGSRVGGRALWLRLHAARLV